MSTAPKIDFSPDVFEDFTDDEPLPALPPAKPRWSTRRTIFVVSIGILLALGIVYFTTNHQAASKSGEERGVGTVGNPLLLPSLQQAVMAAPVHPMSPTAWCTGDEVVCTTVISSTPVQTLKKLVVATPEGSAKQYKVRLSITPIEPEDFDPATNKDAPTLGERAK